jgi:O-antigen/teichoic acid export membrane protein
MANDNLNLKTIALSGVSWTAFSSVIGILFNLVQIAVLARVLITNDFGLMALVLVVVNFSNIFTDLGFSKAVVQKQHTNQVQLSTLFWLNIISGILVFVIIWFSAPYIAKFYKSDDLLDLLHLSSIIFLIQPPGQLPLAILQKNFRFRAIEIRNIAARGISLMLTLVLAYNGFGVYSLVYGQIALVGVGTIAIWIAARKAFRLQFSFSLKEVTDYFRFGLFQTGDQITTYFSSQIDTLIIGKVLDTHSLGLYSVAKDLVSKPVQILNPIITKVTFPLIASINDNLKRTKKLYIKIVKIVSFISFPVYAGISLFGLEAVKLILGDKWLEAVSILQILAFVYLLRSKGNPSGSFLQAIGRPDISFYWNLSMMIVIPVFFIVGANWGITGVAVAFLLYQFFGQFPNWYFVLKRGADITFNEFLDSFGVPFISSVFAFTVSLMVNYLSIGYYFQLALKFFVFTCIYLVINLLFNAFVIDELSKAFTQIIRKRGKTE